MQNFFKEHKIIFTICVLDFVALIVLAVAVILQNTRAVSTIDIIYTPASATLTINGKQYQSGQYEINTGSIDVTLAEDGFTTKNVSYQLTENHTTKIYLYLTGDNNDFSYYKTTSSDFALLEKVADDNAQSFIDSYNQALAIKSELPLEEVQYSDVVDENGEVVQTYTKYRIADGNQRAFSDCQTNLCLYCDTVGIDNPTKSYFETMIRNAGYNPADYEIIYQDGIQ